MDQYVYTLEDGWTTDARACRLSADILDVGDALYDHGYRILARSGQGRCGVGAFQVWSAEPPPPTWPRFAIEIEQLDAEGVVWIADLPALWEYLRLYGGVGWQMCQPLPGEQEEEDGGPRCPGCGEPMTRVQQEPSLTVVRQPPELDA